MERLVVSLAALAFAGVAWAQDQNVDNAEAIEENAEARLEVEDMEEEEAQEDISRERRTFGGTASILVGPGFTMGNQPIDGRLSVRGETILVSGDAAELGFVFPIGIAAYSDEQDYSLDFRRTIIDVTPSLRLRGTPLAVISPYVDGGAGVAIFTRDVEGNYFGPGDDDIANVAPVLHAALGAEIGGAPDGGLVFIVEPIQVNDYILPGEDGLRFASMIGVGATF